MYRSLLFLAICFFFLNTGAQVFNSGANMGGKAVTIGLQPVMVDVGRADDPVLFMHADITIVPTMHIAAKAGLSDGSQYFGGAAKWNLAKVISLSAGVHKYGRWGLDGSFILSLPLKNDSYLFTGADMDMNFDHNDVHTPLWIPVGLSVGVSKVLAVALETDFALCWGAYHIVGGGIIFKF